MSNYPYTQADETPKLDAEANEAGASQSEKNFVEYVTCDVCGNRYTGIKPKGGDGSVLLVHKHTRSANLLRKREECPGSRRIAREYKHG